MPYKQIYVEGRMFEPGYEGDKKKIIRLFEDIGYYNTSVKTEIVYVSPSQVDIIYTINQSNRYKIGAIRIHGNETTKDSVIRRLMACRPGQYYSRTRLEGDTARLLRTQFFELSGYGVRIIPRRASAPFDPQKYIDLDVEVREGDTYDVRNGYVTLFRGSMRLNTGRYGSLTPSEEIIDETNEANNMSDHQYEEESRSYYSRGYDQRQSYPRRSDRDRRY